MKLEKPFVFFYLETKEYAFELNAQHHYDWFNEWKTFGFIILLFSFFIIKINLLYVLNFFKLKIKSLLILFGL